MERQSDSVTQEVADAVCGEVRTMLLEHLYSWEFVLPDGNLCDPPRTAGPQVTVRGISEMFSNLKFLKCKCFPLRHLCGIQFCLWRASQYSP